MNEIQAVDVCNRAISLENGLRRAFIALGALLHKIKNERLYEQSWGSWEAYCDEFSDLTPSTISKLIKGHEKMVLEYGFPGESLEKLGWTKTYLIASKAKDKEQAQEWMEKGEILTRNDLERETKPDCAHTDTYKLEVCRGCGDRWRV